MKDNTDREIEKKGKKEQKLTLRKSLPKFIENEKNFRNGLNANLTLKND